LRRAALVLPLLLLLGAAVAEAQMPDLRRINGQPLPAAEMPAGTINVRVSKQIPVNGVPDLEVTAIVTNAGGDSRKRVAKTGADGRAVFEGVAPGNTFEATAVVEGETLKTLKFPVPPTGGTRILLIAGLGPAPEGGQASEAASDPGFSLGSVTGQVKPKEGLPAGTLEVALIDEAGKPIAGRVVQLGQVGNDNAVRVHKATSDAAGLVVFPNLATGESAGYAAVIEHQGMRLGTEAFRMSATAGMRGEIKALGRTADPAGVITLDNRARLILEVGEDALQMMEELIFKNKSDRVFHAPEDGLLIPLPRGFTGAKELEGGVPLDVREGQGVAVRAPVPPNTGALFATRVRVGFVVPAEGSSSVTIEQPMPFGLEGALLLVPENAKLTPEGPGLRLRESQPDSHGNAVKLYEIDAVPPGGTLTFTVRGLPALDRTGRHVAGALCLLLVIAAVVGSVGRRTAAQTTTSTDKLAERREKLFAELVALERRRKAEAKKDAALEAERQALVGKLEAVYRELAQVAHGPLR
jgi:hypothetical protein